MDQNICEIFKILFVGDTGVGKTNILYRLYEGSLPKTQEPTTGVEYASKTITVQDKIVKAKMWDTAGNERYRTIIQAYFRDVMGALVVYDITEANSFQSVVEWIKNIRREAAPNVVIMLVGNKIDLVKNGDEQRQVAIKDAELLALEFKVLFVEVSALSNYNIDQCFTKLIEEIIKVNSFEETTQVN